MFPIFNDNKHKIIKYRTYFLLIHQHSHLFSRVYIILLQMTYHIWQSQHESCAIEC